MENNQSFLGRAFDRAVNAKDYLATKSLEAGASLAGAVTEYGVYMGLSGVAVSAGAVPLTLASGGSIAQGFTAAALITVFAGHYTGMKIADALDVDAGAMGDRVEEYVNKKHDDHIGARNIDHLAP